MPARETRAAAREEKRERLPAQLEQMKYALPHNAKYDWLMREALTTNCQ